MDNIFQLLLELGQGNIVLACEKFIKLYIPPLSRVAPSRFLTHRLPLNLAPKILTLWPLNANMTMNFTIPATANCKRRGKTCFTRNGFSSAKGTPSEMKSIEERNKPGKKLIFFSIQPDRQQHYPFVTVPLLSQNEIWSKKISTKV